MSIELVCDGCGKRLKQSPLGMIPLGSQEWAEIEVRVPRKVQAKGKFVGRLVPEQVPRYMLCSSQCVHKILAKVEKELDDAFKAVSAGGQSER